MDLVRRQSGVIGSGSFLFYCLLPLEVKTPLLRDDATLVNSAVYSVGYESPFPSEAEYFECDIGRRHCAASYRFPRYFASSYLPRQWSHRTKHGVPFL